MCLFRLDVVWLNMSSFCPILFECRLYNSISVHSSVIYYGLSVRGCSLLKWSQAACMGIGL